MDRSALVRARADAARYTSTQLRQPMTLAGTPTVRLTATRSAPSADFVSWLSEITAGGQVISVAQGAVDTSRAGLGPYEVGLDAVAIQLPASSRLLLTEHNADYCVDRYGFGASLGVRPGRPAAAQVRPARKVRSSFVPGAATYSDGWPLRSRV